MNPFDAASAHFAPETVEELRCRIERLIPKAETGEQWAQICALEQRMINLINTGDRT